MYDLYQIAKPIARKEHRLYPGPSPDEWRCTCERWTVSGPEMETIARLRHAEHVKGEKL